MIKEAFQKAFQVIGGKFANKNKNKVKTDEILSPFSGMFSKMLWNLYTSIRSNIRGGKPETEESLKKLANTKIKMAKTIKYAKIIWYIVLFAVAFCFILLFVTALIGLFSFNYDYSVSNYKDSSLYTQTVNEELLMSNFYDKVSSTSYYQRFSDSSAIDFLKQSAEDIAKTRNEIENINTNNDYNPTKTELEALYSSIAGYYNLSSNSLIHDANLNTLSGYMQANAIDSSVGLKSAMQGNLRYFFNKYKKFEL